MVSRSQKSSRVDLPKLAETMKKDYQNLQSYRMKLYDAVCEFAGSNYGDNDVCNPVNLLSLYVKIIMGTLVGAEPRMMVSTFDRTLKSMIGTFEKWGNRRLVQMGYADVLRQQVQDALFLVGIAKTSITAPAESRFSGYHKAVGQPAISNISFQKFCCDTRAVKFSECQYLGHKYCALLEDVSQSKLFDKKARKQLVPRRDKMFNEGGDEVLESIGRSQFDDGYRDYVELWEVYDSLDRVIITFDADGDFETPLLVQDWVGPECGPYDFLMFLEVPGNLLPKSPIMDLIDMHREMNSHWKKLNNQASRAKEVVFYRDAEDGSKVQDAVDGTMVQSNSPDLVKAVSVGMGPNVPVTNWTMNGMQQFSRFAGNLDALGGLQSQADTASQEKLVTQSASNLVNAMGVRVAACSQRQMLALAWFWWMHPEETMESTYSPQAASEFQIARKLDPLDRYGKRFEDMEITIDPYSLQSQTPQTRVMMIDDLVKNFILPTLPLFGQPGVSDLLDAYIRLKAKYTNNPDMIDLLEKLVGVQGPSEAAAQNPQGPQGGPEETIHTRVSRPGMSDEANQQVIMQSMANGQMAGPTASNLGQMGAA